MARTLKQLQDSVQRLIEQQGEDAPVAAFLFTKEDVFRLDEDGNHLYDIPVDVAAKVLSEVEEDDQLYCQAFDVMDQYLQVIGEN